MNINNKTGIFDQSNCLSPEQLKGYWQNLLGAEQKFEVEKHLVDCELCTEALEGVALLASAEPIDNIKQEVENLVQKNKPAVKSIRRQNFLLAAASVAGLLLFGAVAVNYFISQQKEDKVAQTINVPVVKQQEPVEFKTNEAEEATIATDSITVTNNLSKAELKSLSENTFDSKGKNAQANTSSGSFNAIVQSEATKQDELFAQEQVQAIADDARPAENRELSNMRNATAPPEMKANASRMAMASAAGIIFKEGLRIYDYSMEYAPKDVVPAATSGVDARYENEKAMAKEKVLEEKDKKILTYSEVLTAALKNYNSKNYKVALQDFNTISEKYPDNVNAIFYSAMCYEQTGKYDKALSQLDRLDILPNKIFSEESEWHRALVLEKQGKEQEAIVLYKKIAVKGGFYRERAAGKVEDKK